MSKKQITSCSSCYAACMAMDLSLASLVSSSFNPWPSWLQAGQSVKLAVCMVVVYAYKYLLRLRTCG